MATIIDMRSNLKSLKLKDIATDAIDKTAEVMVDLNVEQLKSGFDSRGHRLKSYRNKKYAEKKNRMNPLPGMWHPDLILTGAFVGGISVKLQGDSVNFKSTDSKAPELLKKYGDDVLGLSEKQQDYYNWEVFFYPFMGTINNYLGL